MFAVATAADGYLMNDTVAAFDLNSGIGYTACVRHGNSDGF
jgi:hypothetical protein